MGAGSSGSRSESLVAAAETEFSGVKLGKGGFTARRPGEGRHTDWALIKRLRPREGPGPRPRNVWSLSLGGHELAWHRWPSLPV